VNRHPDRIDVVVIGAGPGGSTTATKLAQSGRSVLLLERRRHPRFHIGESMLPMMNAVAERIGVLGRIEAQGFPIKRGAEFAKAGSPKYARAPFTANGPGRHHETFQVERAHFDKLLADFAVENGAILLENATVQRLIQEDGRVVGVEYDHEGTRHSVRADHVVDAGGRASKVSQTFGLRNHLDRMRMVAVFRHFKGLDEAHNPGEPGDIMIGGHPDGWVWAIPIWPDTISVGSVMRREVFSAGDPERLLGEHADRIDRIRQRLTGTVPHGDIHIETDYCYYSDTITGPGWLMAGDAACFFDPIFSGGTYLAMATGYQAARTVDAILDRPDEADRLLRSYSNFYKTGYDAYARVIFAYYEGDYNIRPYMRDIGYDHGHGEWAENTPVVRMLSGDFWSEDNPLHQIMLKETRWDFFAPFEPEWGCPFYGDAEKTEAGRG
jgi:FADH2-dependent halogenase